MKKTPIKGRGIFAKKEVPAGTVIGDYLGIVTATKDEDEEKFGTYYLWYNDKSSVYADPKKIGIHIINHSCMPNCDMYAYQTHMLYYAVRTIFKDEELTVSYALGVPGESCSPCSHACFCETPLCTGSWHSPELHADVFKKDSIKNDLSTENAALNKNLGEVDDEDSEVYLPPGAELTFLSSYPQKVRLKNPEKLFGSLNHTSLQQDNSSLPSISELRKLIRKSGRILRFSQLNLTVLGIQNNLIILQQSQKQK